MIQDISPMQLNNHYDPAIKADDESLIVIFRGKERWRIRAFQR